MGMAFGADCYKFPAYPLKILAGNCIMDGEKTILPTGDRPMAWLATTWTVENRDEKTFYPGCEIALEKDKDGKPIMTRDGVVFLLALPNHLARPNSILSFNWNKTLIEVWEGLRWIGNLHLTECIPLD
jgi:hypothetical protein